MVPMNHVDPEKIALLSAVLLSDSESKNDTLCIKIPDVTDDEKKPRHISMDIARLILSFLSIEEISASSVHQINSQFLFSLKELTIARPLQQSALVNYYIFPFDRFTESEFEVIKESFLKNLNTAETQSLLDTVNLIQNEIKNGQDRNLVSLTADVSLAVNLMQKNSDFALGAIDAAPLRSLLNSLRDTQPDGSLKISEHSPLEYLVDLASFAHALESFLEIQEKMMLFINKINRNQHDISRYDRTEVEMIKTFFSAKNVSSVLANIFKESGRLERMTTDKMIDILCTCYAPINHGDYFARLIAHRRKDVLQINNDFNNPSLDQLCQMLAKRKKEYIREYIRKVRLRNSMWVVFYLLLPASVVTLIVFSTLPSFFFSKKSFGPIELATAEPVGCDVATISCDELAFNATGLSSNWPGTKNACHNWAVSQLLLEVCNPLLSMSVCHNPLLDPSVDGRGNLIGRLSDSTQRTFPHLRVYCKNVFAYFEAYLIFPCILIIPLVVVGFSLPFFVARNMNETIQKDIQQENWKTAFDYFAFLLSQKISLYFPTSTAKTNRMYSAITDFFKKIKPDAPAGNLPASTTQPPQPA